MSDPRRDLAMPSEADLPRRAADEERHYDTYARAVEAASGFRCLQRAAFHDERSHGGPSQPR